MTNKISFWDEYNKKAIAKIEELCKKKRLKRESFVRVDWHIHSNHSSDASQSIYDILKNAREKKFEIISITDHDSVSAYDELYDKFYPVLHEDSFPILIPRIEHTVSYPVYGEMCHILKHFINPMDIDLRKDIKKLENSYFYRASIQISRLQHSVSLQKMLGNNISEILEFDFLKFLQEQHITLPDYWPLIEYISKKLKKYKISNTELYDQLKKDNLTDPCEQRKKIKEKRFQILDKKYADNTSKETNRFLLSILAVRGLDDDKFPDYPISGSLSVNEYNQPSIFELNQSGITSFAHPTEKALFLVKDVLSIGGGLIGIENNYKNKYNTPSQFEKFSADCGLIEIIGSDMHALNEAAYDDLEFYNMSLYKLERYIFKVKNKIFKVN